MKVTFTTFIKKHLALILALVLIPSAVIAIFALCYSGNLSVRDWMSFSGAALTYMGTVLVSSVALYQSEQANSLSKRTFEFSLREYMAAFQISRVEFRKLTKTQVFSNLDWLKNILCTFFFFQLDSDMEYYQCYKVELKNYGIYPIIHIRLSGDGYIERKHCKEHMENEVDTLIQPGGTFSFLICNFLEAENFSNENIYQISCENIYRVSMSIELKITRIKERDGSIETVYSYKLLEDIP